MSAERKYPALGPEIWLVLAKNEWFKARHRLAFLVTLGMYVFITVMEHASSVQAALEREDVDYGLPEAWRAVFDSESVILVIFASIAVIMLTSSEFSWRTARQNVIDGVGKMQWFGGKVILLLIVGLTFLFAKISIGFVATLIGTDFGSGATIVPLSVFAATGALLLAFLSTGGLALLLSVSARASGPAMALWFFWITLGEQLLPAIVTRIAPDTAPAFAYLPFAAAQQVMSFATFDATTRANILARAAEAGSETPEFADPLLWSGVNAGWALLFLVSAYLLFRQRDL